MRKSNSKQTLRPAIVEKRPVATSIWSAVLIVGLLCVGSGPVAAQGSIFGAVTGSGGGAPTEGEISFIGFLNGLDEELRTDICVGAGYGEGHWFDDFQNFLTEAPGLPYEYRFFRAEAGEGFALSSVVPDNSFQQEDISLASVSWPSAPQGLTGQFAGSEVQLGWVYDPGHTYHVYRRQAPSGGSFFRVDVDPAPSGHPGLADSAFTDIGVEPSATYEYLFVAENGSGVLSPHSALLTVSPGGGGCCEYRGDIDNSGSAMPDISDLVFLVNYMFQEGPEPLCMAAADINADQGSIPDISDLVYLVNYMFQEGPPPPPCQ